MWRPPILLVVGLAVGLARPASALDYLEHSWFTDRACREAQARLSAQLTAHPNDAAGARYLALSLACPERWQTQYCGGDVKLLEGNLNELAAPPVESGDHSVTLGDFAALPDHLSQFGAVSSLPRAAREGLVSRTLEWLLPRSGDPGGVVGDVAEDACETDDLVDWDHVERDVSAAIGASDGVAVTIPEHVFWPSSRLPPAPGPGDSAGLYSFDNPHYLDLVLLNHAHFGTRAYATWLGFHSAARALADRGCPEAMTSDEDELEDLSEGLDGFSEVDWSDLPAEERRRRGCEALAKRLVARISRWSSRTDPGRLAPPVASLLARLPDDPVLADRVAAALLAIVFEGAGLHFLQDGLAGGHLRVERAAYGLELSRHMHDADNANGVVAELGTPTRSRRFVAFGDTRMLGRSLVADARCTWSDTGTKSRAEVTACLLREQRGLLVTTSAAALVDWAVGGALYAGDPESCLRGPAHAYVCRHLPTRAAIPSGEGETGTGPAVLQHGALPQPPPPFSYQSLSASLSADASGEALQPGVRLVFLSELDDLANWMTSYHFGLLSTVREGDASEALVEFSYMFHWRWAARWLVNAGPYTYTGLRGFGHDVSSFHGVGGSFGTSVLPEGSTKIPLEISLTYRVPVTLLDSRRALSSDAIELEAHWLELAIGLAFL